jgi:hypothetical protein
MRKTTIIPAMALSLLTLGSVSAMAVPAGAATHHASIRTAGEDDDTTSPTTPEGSGGGSTPSGGAATGAGGMATGGAADVAPWLAAGGAGIALLGAGALSRRRRPVEA